MVKLIYLGRGKRGSCLARDTIVLGRDYLKYPWKE